MDGANYIGVYIMGVTFDTFSTVTFERVKVENISIRIFPWTYVMKEICGILFLNNFITF